MSKKHLTDEELSAEWCVPLAIQRIQQSQQCDREA